MLRLAWLLMLTSVSRAYAQAPPGRVDTPPAAGISLSYGAPAGCPVRAAFWQRLLQHVEGPVPHDDPSAARQYRVVIEQTREGYRGELEKQHQADTRQLTSANCEKVADALALMLVLSLDARSDPGDALAPASPASVPVVPSDAKETRSPRAAATGREKPVLPEVPRPISALATLGGLAWFGATPDALLGSAAGYEWGLVPRLLARVEVRAAMASDRADEKFLGMAALVCARADSSNHQVLGCGGGVGGYLPVAAVEYSGGRQSSFWVAPALSLRWRLHVTGSAWLEVAAEVESALVRRDYVVKRDDSSFSTPAVSGLVELSLGTGI